MTEKKSLSTKNGTPEAEELPVPSEEEGCTRRGACCRNSPGWFAPGEMEKAAEFLKLSPKEFVSTYCIIDGIELPDHGRVDVFAPLKTDRFGEPALPPLERVDWLYRELAGSCIFFTDNGCSIYPARPIECARYLCSQPPEKNISHTEIARMWVSGTAGSSKQETED
ncbi:MAG: hypothetical protein GY754_38600 [bacterium]|nr:hypothetical protein [bacterium]